MRPRCGQTDDVAGVLEGPARMHPGQIQSLDRRPDRARPGRQQQLLELYRTAALQRQLAGVGINSIDPGMADADAEIVVVPGGLAQGGAGLVDAAGEIIGDRHPRVGRSRLAVDHQHVAGRVGGAQGLGGDHPRRTGADDHVARPVVARGFRRCRHGRRLRSGRLLLLLRRRFRRRRLRRLRCRLLRRLFHRLGRRCLRRRCFRYRCRRSFHRRGRRLRRLAQPEQPAQPIQHRPPPTTPAAAASRGSAPRAASSRGPGSTPAASCPSR